MPQPLSRITSNHSEFVIGSRQVVGGTRVPLFREHTEFAILAMECIAEWAHIEMDIIMLYARLCRGPLQDAFQVYASLNGSGPKTAALLKLVQNKFRKQDLEIFDAVRALTKSCEKRRNKLVHWTWGTMRDRTDCILLVDPMDLINRSGNLDLSLVEVWFKQDFSALANETRSLSSCHSLMSTLAHGSAADRDEVGDLMRKKPEIAVQLRNSHSQ